MMKKTIMAALLWAAALSIRPAAADFQANVSATTIPEGESFQLYLRQDGGGADPDVSVLNADFTVVMQRKSYKSSYVNGKSQTFNENVLTLIPKKTGEVVLPSIRAGREQTKPLKLTVVAGGTAVSAPSGERADAARQSNVFIRSEIADKTPYVGQQTVLTVKLYSFVQTPLLDGTVAAPRADGVVAEQWGDAKRSRETVNGRLYDVLEYKYLLFSNKTGRVALPPFRFQGMISDPDGRDADLDDDPFGFGGFFTAGFGGQKVVAAQTAGIELNVREKPDHVTGAWLPATNVAVSETVEPAGGSVALGDALTRTVTVSAAGARDSQIPDVVFPDGSAYKQYPGKTDSKNVFDNGGIVGVKTRQIVFMPTEAGRVVLPALEIPWFDVASGQTRKAVLPARTVVVTGAAVSAPVRPENTAQTVPPPVEKKAETEAVPAASAPAPAATAEGLAVLEKIAAQSPLRLFLAGILAGCFVVTALGLAARYLFFKNKGKAEGGARQNVSLRTAAGDLKSACRSGDAERAKAALLAVGQSLWPERPPLTLSALAGRFNDAALTDQVEKLNGALYGGRAAKWDGNALWTVFQSAQSAAKTGKNGEKPPVPPLYPQ